MSLTAEQMEQRRGKITASLMPEIVGVSPYSGALGAWLRITGRHEEDARTGSDPRQWGHDVEEKLLANFAARMGVELDFPGSVIHPEHPWLLATPDAMVRGAKAVVEAKNVNARVAARHWQDGPPDYVRVQVATQLAVMGADEGFVVASLGGEAPEIFHLDRNTVLHGEPIEAIIEIGHDFYQQHVVTDDPPPPDDQTRVEELARLFPKSSGAIVPAPVEASAIVERYRAACTAVDAAEQAKENAQKDLCSLIADRDGIEGVDWIATWKKTASNGIDYRQLVAHIFAVAPPPGLSRAALEKQFTRPGTRRFSLRDVNQKTGSRTAA